MDLIKGKTMLFALAGVLIVGFALGYRVGAGQWLPRVSVDL